MDWIEEFLAATEGTGRPKLFRQWSAIATISAVLQRRVWVTTMGKAFFPNLYIIVVGPAGVGKSFALDYVMDFLAELPTLHVSATSVNFATLIDELADARVDVIDPTGHAHTFHSLFICQSELGVLMPTYDTTIMNKLQQLWDSRTSKTGYSERRRTHRDGEKTEIHNPLLGMIAATTPSYLNSTLPPQAWDQGFISRCLFVFSGEASKKSIFENTGVMSPDEFNSLNSRLKKINELWGEFTFTPAFRDSVDAWQQAEEPPRPDHPKLIHYLTRRISNVVKLSMISSVVRSRSLRLEEQDFLRARAWLIESEETIPDIFRSMSTVGGDSAILQETWHFVYTVFIKSGKRPIPQASLYLFLSEKAPSYRHEQIVKALKLSGLLKEVRDEKFGLAYVPQGMKE